jgi:hypothetical protein
MRKGRGAGLRCRSASRHYAQLRSTTGGIAMRLAALAAIVAATLLPAAALAQNTPPATAAAAPAPHASSLVGMTRDAYIHREERRAAAHFDRIDANHDGVLQQSEIDAWRAAHPRRHRARAKPAKPPA